MTSKTFNAGTVIDSAWLNDVNTATYTTVPANTTNIATINANNWVITTRINDGAVTAAKLATDSVTTIKLVDGNVTAAKLAANAATGNLGYTPVQQGTGIGQLGNTVKIGWNGSNIKATIDSSDQGILYTGNNNPILPLGSGYQKLASGLIIQWGNFGYSSASGTVTFPTTFPTALTSIQLTNNGGYAAASATTSSTFTYGMSNTSGTCFWIAVGL